MEPVFSLITLLAFLASFHIPSTLALSLQAPPPAKLTAPRPPAGFRIELFYEAPPRILNPIGIYICAIKALAVWAGPPWDSISPPTGQMDIPELNIRLSIVGEGGTLRLCFVLMGIYEAVLQITEEKRFQAAKVRVFRGKKEVVGEMDFLPLVAKPIPEEVLQSIRNVSAAPPVINNGSLGITNEFGGHFVHSQFPWLILGWTFVTGRRIPASEIFTAIMDAIVSTADEPGPAQRDYIHGLARRGIRR